jgi:hypothetical protein
MDAVDEGVDVVKLSPSRGPGRVKGLIACQSYNAMERRRGRRKRVSRVLIYG